MIKTNDFSQNERLNNEPMETAEPPRDRKSAAEEVFVYGGEMLGWKNETAEPDKIQDIELLSASGYDFDWVKEHHRVRDLLEANAVYSGGYSPADIYRAIEKRKPLYLEVNIKDKIIKTEIRTLVQFMKIKESNRMLGSFKLSEEGDGGLIEKFFSGADLKVSTEKAEVDLREKCPLDQLEEDFDFEGYFEKIKDNQIGLQFMGEMKDEALKKHHIENAGYAQFYATGKIEPNGMKEFIWVPVSPTIAGAEARGDLPKTGARFRSAGHVHEVGSYEERTGTTVKFNKKLLGMHRGDITTDKVHEETNTRMYKAAVGLGAKEDFVFYKVAENFFEDEENNKKFETAIKSSKPTLADKKEFTVVDIGNDHKGLIYKGLHHTYDKAMKELRGQELKQDEADDLLFTDIIAPFLMSNSRDWAMCLAKNLGSRIPSYTSLMAAQGKSWADYKFCLKIRCRDLNFTDKFVVKPHIFFSIEQLIDYLNERIAKLHDIEGEPIEFKPMTKEEAEAAAIEDEEQEDETKKKLEPEEIRNYGYFFYKIFGDEDIGVLETFAEKDLEVKVMVKGQTVVLREYLEEILKKTNDSLILRVAGVGGDKGIEKIMEILNILSPESKKELLDLAKSKKQSKKDKSKKK